MKRRWTYHIAFWLTFWFIYAYTYSRYDGQLGKYIYTEGVQMPARMLAAYLSIWCFERFSAVDGSKTWFAFSGAALANIVGGGLNRLLKLWYLVPVFFQESTISFWNIRMVYDIFDCVVASSTALSARLYFQQQALIRREHQLRAEKAEAELSALKNQLQPHFLFNTINNLYALARVKSDKTPAVAQKLAGLLRYILYEAQKPEVRLEQEIQLLEDYIALEKLRFDEGRLEIRLETAVDAPVTSIAPLLLLPLIENAFKHGAAEQRKKARIDVSIQLKNKQLQVSIRNSRPQGIQAGPPGIGLQNLKKQLQLLYPDRHYFQTNESAGQFEAELSIQL